jgi:hypothetical protein
MANFTAEDIAEALNIIQSKKSEEAEKEKLREELRAELEAEAKAKAPVEEEEKEEEKEEEAPKSDDRENRLIAKEISIGLEKAGVDGDVVKSIHEFIDYGTLKSEEGEADETKITSLIESLTSLARREPPKGRSKRDVHDDGSMSKYLPSDK